MPSAAVYALVAQEKQYPLQIGKNVVGRSSVPVDGVSFINLESPLAAISRMQAFLDVAVNGDAWISDCNSTNGTFLSVRPGPGIRLEANRYYQLTPGCRIVFGDVECVFEVLSGHTHTAGNTNTSPSSSTARASRKTERLQVTGATADLKPHGDKGKTPDKADSSKVHRSDVPYLDESASLSRENSSSPVAPTEVGGKTTTKKGGKRNAPSSASLSPAPQKKVKKEATPAASGTLAEAAKSSSRPSAPNTSTAPPVVCLTGMDSDERAAITKRVRQLKGRVTEDITKANLLVVAMPAVRTPKFIIAVARGIPIVSVKYVCNDQAELEDARHHIVGLKTDQHTYSAAALESVIYRKDRRPLLQGVRINVSALPNKTKSVATEIITASGGAVIRTKKADALNLTEDQVDTLYDSILRGKVPQSL